MLDEAVTVEVRVLCKKRILRSNGEASRQEQQVLTVDFISGTKFAGGAGSAPSSRESLVPSMSTEPCGGPAAVCAPQ